MKRSLFYKAMYDFFSFFWLQRAGKLITWIISVSAIHGVRFHAAETIYLSRPLGIGNAKSLYRPEARNGISVQLPMKGESKK